jgi:hypothetical protein
VEFFSVLPIDNEWMAQLSQLKLEWTGMGWYEHAITHMRSPDDSKQEVLAAWPGV